jgi:Cof subfamily protein (haloacid dehalogenase superfamily)
MDRAILFFDIDGTIVSEDGKRFIPESAINAIHKARNNGHITVVNTGRTYLTVERHIKELGFSGFICGCGTNIFLGDEVLLRHKNDRALCFEIRDELESLGIPAIYESAECLGFNADTYIHPELREMLSYFGFKGLMIEEAHEESFYFDKFFCWANDDEHFEPLVSKLSAHFQVIRRGDTPGIKRIEVVPKGYSKATGMEFMLNKLGIDHKNSYAFGDSTNDLPMLEYAAHSAAMGGCPEVLRDKVEFVTDGLYEDGLAKALERFGLI